jgi:hypothetical protein
MLKASKVQAWGVVFLRQRCAYCCWLLVLLLLFCAQEGLCSQLLIMHAGQQFPLPLGAAGTEEPD